LTLSKYLSRSFVLTRCCV